MAFNDFEKEDIVELLEQARFELTRQKKERSFEKSILAEYEFEVTRLYDRNRALEDELKRAEKKMRLLQESSEVSDEDSLPGRDTVGQSSDEGVDDGSWSSGPLLPWSHGTAPQQRTSRCHSETSLRKTWSKTACLATSSIGSGCSEGFCLSQQNPFVLAVHTDCQQCRLNDAERDEILDEMHDLREQIATIKEVNVKLLAELDQQTQQIGVLTGELFTLRTAYSELEDQTQHLRYEKELIERDVADIRNHQLGNSLSIESDKARGFSTGSSIGDELGLPARLVNFGETERYREISENVNWDALLEVNEATELTDRIEPISEHWVTNTQNGLDVIVHTDEPTVYKVLSTPWDLPTYSPQSTGGNIELCPVETMDRQMSEPSSSISSTVTSIDELSYTQADQANQEGQIEFEWETPRHKILRTNDEPLIPADARSQGSAQASQLFGHWVKSFEALSTVCPSLHGVMRRRTLMGSQSLRSYATMVGVHPGPVNRSPPIFATGSCDSAGMLGDLPSIKLKQS